MRNSYSFDTPSGPVMGQFKIYQSVDGQIMLVMNLHYTPLTREQIEDLLIDVYRLENFDLDIFIEKYNYTPPEIKKP